MKKVALVFILAVFVPSLVLAWLAVRSLRDQQFVLERQQSLLFQNVADSLAKEAESFLGERQHEFALQVETLLAGRKPAELAPAFDDQLRTNWPLAEVGFVVSLTGDLMCPSPVSRVEARRFRTDNSMFLCNRESVEVYWNQKAIYGNGAPDQKAQVQQRQEIEPNAEPREPETSQVPALSLKEQPSLDNNYNSQKFASANNRAGNYKIQQRMVSPQQSIAPEAGFNKFNSPQAQAPVEDFGKFSKLAPSETEFRQLIGDNSEGTLARFVDNKLQVMFWHRSPLDPRLVFGVQLALPRLAEGLQAVMQQFEPAFREEICIALLDDKARPVAASRSDFRNNWKRPFVATEIGEALPHWEATVYLLDPTALSRSAQTLRLTLGLLISVLVLAIAVGSWLIVADLNRQLALARQKTDFVSNVSHELKTPLTSIRMFSELLADGRVTDAAKQRSYLSIITAETARLTRLINNVLDFARLERGEKKYQFQPIDLLAVVRETAETYRPHLEANGFQFACDLPDAPILVNGDRDALAQVIVNLLSNAEKYSDSRKEIALRVERHDRPLPYAEVKICDRGIGVPEGCAEKIFEQFYRAHDSLSSGIQGSGLGLTLARQIARAHAGDVCYQPQEGGGSCFLLRIPLKNL
jgi:signal transduction histidine kinase